MKNSLKMLRNAMMAMFTVLVIFLSIETGFCYEIVLEDGRTIDAVSYWEEGDQIRFKLQEQGKRYVIDKRSVVSIDGRDFQTDVPESEHGSTRIFLHDGRTVEVETCWAEGNEIRFKKAGSSKTYQVQKALVAKIEGEYEQYDSPNVNGNNSWTPKKNDDDTAAENDELYEKRAYLIHRIKAYEEEVTRERKLLGDLKKTMRHMKGQPVWVIRKEHAWGKSKVCFETETGVECRKPATPQQYKSYVIRGMREDVRKKEKNLSVSEALLAEYKKELEVLESPVVSSQ